MNWNSISFLNETLKKCLGKLRNQSNSAAVNCLKLQDQLLTDRTTWNPGIYQKEESPVCWSPGFCVKRYRHKESSGYVRILRRHNILDFESRALTIRPSSSVSPIFFFESFYSCTFSPLDFEMIELRCQKKCRNIYIRIILFLECYVPSDSMDDL